MNELTQNDLHFVLSRLPKDVRSLMENNNLMIGGGFIRATIAGEKVSDIDIFGKSVEQLKLKSNEITISRRARLHETQNAITVLCPPRLPLQFITRWVYDNLDDLVKSFDYTIAQAAIGFNNGKWISRCSEYFYPDLAARRLNYTFPIRNEDAGGSLLRMRKFLKRGYTIQANSLGKVIARLISGIDEELLYSKKEADIAQVITGLLREVDPLIVMDGIEIVDEHEVKL